MEKARKLKTGAALRGRAEIQNGLRHPSVREKEKRGADRVKERERRG